MARPKKKEELKHEKRFPTVRCTASELSDLHKLAAESHMSLSDFIRTKSLKGEVLMSKSHDLDRYKFIYELNAIGKNLNQIAKRLNSTGVISEGIETVNRKIEDVLDLILNESPIQP